MVTSLPKPLSLLELEDTLLLGMNSVPDRSCDWESLQLPNMQSFLVPSQDHTSNIIQSTGISRYF